MKAKRYRAMYYALYYAAERAIPQIQKGEREAAIQHLRDGRAEAEKIHREKTVLRDRLYPLRRFFWNCVGWLEVNWKFLVQCFLELVYVTVIFFAGAAAAVMAIFLLP